MNRDPLVIHTADLEWETWNKQDIPSRGLVYWKTLVSGDRTPSDSITLGFARVPSGEQLQRHRHAQAEVYYVLRGSGSVHLDGRDVTVESGIAVFIPGRSVHGIRNTGSEPLEFIYAFPANSFQDIDYVFDVGPSAPELNL